MNEQKARARAARGNISGWSDSSRAVLKNVPETEFVGYTAPDVARAEAKLLAIITDDGTAEKISEGEASFIFDKTPFYGEGGGQVGDTGVIESPDGSFRALVLDTKKTNGVYIHEVKIECGEARIGEEFNLAVLAERRAAIARNHSAAHLLQAALRSVLGTHVEQAGSYVDENRVRFDFTHLAPMSAEEILRVEETVNRAILLSESCETVVTTPAEAKKMGAMALFGEKYGKTVRVVKIGTGSTELCGGTHVSNTGNIGLFKIISESSVAAGVRRIEGTTGLGVLLLLAERDALIRETARELKSPNVLGIAKKAEALTAELRETRRELESANSRLADIKAESLLDGIKSVGKCKLLVAKVEMRPDAVRALCDTVKERHPDAVAVFATVLDGKLNFVAAAGSDAVKAGAHAGKILSEISAICGGKGGGRPDSAMSGGREIDKIDEALARAEEIVKNI